MGRFLRASSIDELPQLWNVLRGEMSLVGPRPSLAAETAQFDRSHLRRLEVKPGITGLWQVEARDSVDFDEFARLDLRYVDTWSFGVDVVLLARTAVCVAQRVLRVLRRDPGLLA